jgi:N-acylneuraminate cytidylyltransferase
MTRTVTAFIPLKGHSARVPGKNLRDFGGRPLFHGIVNTLQQASTVDGIFIDTDSDEIADSASELSDVIVLRRSAELIGDDVSVNLLIRSFLERSNAQHVIQTHATNPLLTAYTINAAVQRYFADASIDSLFSVTRYQARFYDDELQPINHNPNELLPTQMLSPLYMENSNFYIFSRDGFLASDRRITDRPSVFEMDPLEAIDIDEEADFAMASAVARVQGEHSQ